jgi:hypothetical protein
VRSFPSHTVFLHFLWFLSRLTSWYVIEKWRLYCAVRLGLWNCQLTFSCTLIGTSFFDTKTKAYSSGAACYPRLNLVIECDVLVRFSYRLPFLFLPMTYRRSGNYLLASHGGYLCLNKGICGRQNGNGTSFSSNVLTSPISINPPSVHSRSTYSAIILAIDVVKITHPFSLPPFLKGL